MSERTLLLEDIGKASAVATAYDSDNRVGDAAEETAEICAQKIRNLGAAP